MPSHRPLDRERWQEVSALLDAALELPPEARSHHLEQACGGDVELRRLVEELLAAEASAGSFLTAGALERAAPLVADLADGLEDPAPAGEGPRLIGAYRLLDELGEGGMGTVYLAERVDGQYQQQVAIKLLKQGLAGEDARRRFLQERQILAHLEHPGIARLLDGGVTEEGTPFFVMERVEGQPVTAYCNRQSFGIEQRLRVFLEVCNAVQYAHRNLVVHRDLKPSNILVDAAGRVKLLDFGIAKLLAEGDGAPAETTRTVSRAMTPEYAAPEQVLGHPVTTATDVYALGVLLYELLAGQRPYGVGRGPLSELERAILGQEPPRPSARTAGPGGLPGIGARELRHRLRGDLDGIVLKALEKEPERRYASAEALAADIQRHLEGLPVSARGDRLGYRAWKFARRHRVGVAAAALVLASLIGGLVSTAWQARRAEGEARKAEAVKEFLKSLFSASDPARAQGQERSARQLLDDGARRIETELKGQPEVQSEVARLIGSVYHELGEYDLAEPLLQADLERRRKRDGPRSLAVAQSLNALAATRSEQGRYDEAGALFEEALAIEREKRGERTPQVAELLQRLGMVKLGRGDFAGAEALGERALALHVETKGDDSREATMARNDLALTVAYSRLGEATALSEKVADWHLRHEGPDHPNTLVSRFNHAINLFSLGRLAEVLGILEDVVPRQRRVLGPGHKTLALSLRLLARTLSALGRDEEALPHMTEAVAIHRAGLGPQHVQVAGDLVWRAMIAARTVRLAEAERDVREAMGFPADPSAGGGASMSVVRFFGGVILADAGRLEEGDRLISEAVSVFRAEGSGDEGLGSALDAAGDVARRRGQMARAAALGREALPLLERSVGESPATLLARVHLGAALWGHDQPAEGERLLRQGLQDLQRTFPAGHYDVATAQLLLGEALARSGRPAEARPLLQGALEWRQAHLGPSDPRTVAVRRALGMSRS